MASAPAFLSFTPTDEFADYGGASDVYLQYRFNAISNRQDTTNMVPGSGVFYKEAHFESDPIELFFLHDEECAALNDNYDTYMLRVSTALKDHYNNAANRISGYMTGDFRIGTIHLPHAVGMTNDEFKDHSRPKPSPDTPWMSATDFAIVANIGQSALLWHGRKREIKSETIELKFIKARAAYNAMRTRVLATGKDVTFGELRSILPLNPASTAPNTEVFLLAQMVFMGSVVVYAYSGATVLGYMMVTPGGVRTTTRQDEEIRVEYVLHLDLVERMEFANLQLGDLIDYGAPGEKNVSTVLDSMGPQASVDVLDSRRTSTRSRSVSVTTLNLITNLPTMGLQLWFEVVGILPTTPTQYQLAIRLAQYDTTPEDEHPTTFLVTILPDRIFKLQFGTQFMPLFKNHLVITANYAHILKLNAARSIIRKVQPATQKFSIYHDTSLSVYAPVPQYAHSGIGQYLLDGLGRIATIPVQQDFSPLRPLIEIRHVTLDSVRNAISAYSSLGFRSAITTKNDDDNDNPYSALLPMYVSRDEILRHAIMPYRDLPRFKFHRLNMEYEREFTRFLARLSPVKRLEEDAPASVSLMDVETTRQTAMERVYTRLQRFWRRHTTDHLSTGRDGTRVPTDRDRALKRLQLAIGAAYTMIYRLIPAGLAVPFELRHTDVMDEAVPSQFQFNPLFAPDADELDDDMTDDEDVQHFREFSPLEALLGIRVSDVPPSVDQRLGTWRYNAPNAVSAFLYGVTRMMTGLQDVIGDTLHYWHVAMLVHVAISESAVDISLVRDTIVPMDPTTRKRTTFLVRADIAGIMEPLTMAWSLSLHLTRFYLYGRVGMNETWSATYVPVGKRQRNAPLFVGLLLAHGDLLPEEELDVTHPYHAHLEWLYAHISESILNDYTLNSFFYSEPSLLTPEHLWTGPRLDDHPLARFDGDAPDRKRARLEVAIVGASVKRTRPDPSVRDVIRAWGDNDVAPIPVTRRLDYLYHTVALLRRCNAFTTEAKLSIVATHVIMPPAWLYASRMDTDMALYRSTFHSLIEAGELRKRLRSQMSPPLGSQYDAYTYTQMDVTSPLVKWHTTTDIRPMVTHRALTQVMDASTETQPKDTLPQATWSYHHNKGPPVPIPENADMPFALPTRSLPLPQSPAPPPSPARQPPAPPFRRAPFPTPPSSQDGDADDDEAGEEGPSLVPLPMQPTSPEPSMPPSIVLPESEDEDGDSSLDLGDWRTYT